MYVRTLAISALGRSHNSTRYTQNVTVPDPARLTRSRFLSDYSRLKPTDWGSGVECWRDARFDAKRYDKVKVSRILFSLKPSKEGGKVAIDPSDLKVLTDYFPDGLVKAMKPQMAVVIPPEAGTVGIRIELTSLVPTDVKRSVAGTLTPYAFAAEAGSGPARGHPAGSTACMGGADMEMQFVDATSRAVLGECRETQIGRKYAADTSSGVTGATTTWVSGYANSFQAWSYAKNAFDKWAQPTAQRFAALQGTGAGKQALRGSLLYIGHAHSC